MLIYRDDKSFSQEEAEALFLSVSWESGRYPHALYQALLHSETVISAHAPDFPLAGLMSAVSDGGMNVYFPYLLVHPQMQGHAIGRTLVKLMLARYRSCYRKILVCPDAKIGFYRSVGLEQASEQTAMQRCGFSPESLCGQISQGFLENKQMP